MDPLGALIAWIAGYGLIGLLAIGAAERFIPVLPSYAVLLTIGIAAADGAWSVAAALVGTVIGSFAACLLLYGGALSLGEVRARRLLGWSGRLAGMKDARVDRVISAFNSRQRLLAFGSQLVPTVRLISPVVAGIFRSDARTFAIATMAGIVIWNALFICIGHVAAGVAPDANPSALALNVLFILVASECLLALTWRWLRRPAR